MIVYTARIELPDDATYSVIEEAKIKAPWKIEEKISKAERMCKTDLNNKCGSCIYFESRDYCGSHCYGDCKAGHPWGQRSRPACKDYIKGGL